MGQLYVEGSKVVLMIYFPCNLVTHFQRLMALGYEIFGFNIGDYTTHLGMYQRMEEFCLLVVSMLILNLFIQSMELGIQKWSLIWNITACKKDKETLVYVKKNPFFSYSCLIDEGETFLLTGGGSRGSEIVTRYNINGFVEDLKGLNVQRRDHGCAHFKNNQRKQVSNNILLFNIAILFGNARLPLNFILAKN